MGTAVRHLESLSAQGQAAHDAWNNSAVFLIKAAQAHARYFVVERFVQSLSENDMSPPVKQLATNLCELMLIYWLLERTGDFVLVPTASNFI